jgi:hypothetical protein
VEVIKHPTYGRWNELNILYHFMLVFTSLSIQFVLMNKAGAFSLALWNESPSGHVCSDPIQTRYYSKDKALLPPDALATRGRSTESSPSVIHWPIWTKSAGLFMLKRDILEKFNIDCFVRKYRWVWGVLEGSLCWGVLVFTVKRERVDRKQEKGGTMDNNRWQLFPNSICTSCHGKFISAEVI